MVSEGISYQYERTVRGKPLVNQLFERALLGSYACVDNR